MPNLNMVHLHHPFGMLDRDQRTTFTISEQYRNTRNNIAPDKMENFIKIQDYNKKSYCFTCTKNKQKKNQHYYVNGLPKSSLSQLKPSTRLLAPPLLSSSSSTSSSASLSISDSVLKSTLMKSTFDGGDTTCCSTNNLNEFYSHKSDVKKSTKLVNLRRTKLSNLFILIVLLIIVPTRTSSRPIAMNGNRNGANGDINCSHVLDSFDKIREQAIAAYNEINGENLNNYTKAIFDLPPNKQHVHWRATHFMWLYPKGYPNNGKLKFDDYAEPIPKEELHHLRRVDKQTLENELNELFQRMKLIALTIEKKILTVKNGHQKYGSNRNHRSVMNYFQTQAKMANAVIKEVEYAFRQLGLQYPEVNESQVLCVTDKELYNEVIDWVVTREHLKLLNYVRSAYEEIRKTHCLEGY